MECELSIGTKGRQLGHSIGLLRRSSTNDADEKVETTDSQTNCTSIRLLIYKWAERATSQARALQGGASNEKYT